MEAEMTWKLSEAEIALRDEVDKQRLMYPEAELLIIGNLDSLSELRHVPDGCVKTTNRYMPYGRVYVMVEDCSMFSFLGGLDIEDDPCVFNAPPTCSFLFE